MDKQYFIYLTTNLINGKKYIGKHFGYPNDNYLGSGKILQRAINKYGKQNFHREILDFSATEEENCEKEKYYIALFDACHNNLFYNIHEGGSGENTTKGYTLEQKQALSKKFSVMNSGKNNPMYGVKRSKEYKEYMSHWASNIRDNSVYRTKEYRDNMSKLISGSKNGMYGKHHSEQSKRQMSLHSKGKTAGSKNGMYGKHHSEKSKQLMSLHSKGKTAGEKNGMYGKKGMNSINGKAVVMLDDNYNFEFCFPSVSAVLEFLGMTSHSPLYKAIKKGTLYKGHYWIKKQDFSVETNL